MLKQQLVSQRCRAVGLQVQTRVQANHQYSQGLLNLDADLINAQQQSRHTHGEGDAAPAKGGVQSEGEGIVEHEQEAGGVPAGLDAQHFHKFMEKLRIFEEHELLL